jgi:histidinol phosphatase-like enzyme (inositol monophosphatase family)
MDELKEYKSFCEELTNVSSDIIKQYFRKKITVEVKDDNSPVTIADKKAEEAMREIILKHYPTHGIIGEEFGITNRDAEYKWVLDPIDGTKSFICGAISFGTLIALLKDGKPIIGVYNHPILNDFLLGDNIETRINGDKTFVRKCNELKSAVLLTTDHLNIEKYQDINRFNSLIRKVKLYRNWGDCYGYYLLATGFADIMIDPIMSPWDLLPLIPIVKGAGGVISDFQGYDPEKGNSLVAASPGIHSEVISILNS